MSGSSMMGPSRSPDSPAGLTQAQPERPGPGVPGPGRGRPRAGGALMLALWGLRAGPALMLAGVVLAATLATPLFMTTVNIGNVLDASATIAVLGIGQLLVIITRGIDLSVGRTLMIT